MKAPVFTEQSTCFHFICLFFLNNCTGLQAILFFVEQYCKSLFLVRFEPFFLASVLFIMYSILIVGAGSAWFICDSLLWCRILFALLIEAHHLYLFCGRWKSLILSDSNSTNLQTQLSQEMLFVIPLYKLRLKKISILIFQDKNT